MLTSALPVTPPPASEVADLNPEAARAINEFRDFERSLPARRSPEQLNRLDDLRIAAFNELNSLEFLEALAREEADLLSGLANLVTALREAWMRLEAVRSLREWPAQPERFRPKPISCMTVTLGNGYTKTVTGRELIAALADTVGGH